jgi:hypothetical protein
MVMLEDKLQEKSLKFNKTLQIEFLNQFQPFVPQKNNTFQTQIYDLFSVKNLRTFNIIFAFFYGY